MNHQEAFAQLGETLKTACRRGPVYYLPNSGNLGDGLIRHGTLKFLDDIGLHYKELGGSRVLRLFQWLGGGTIIYGGGGGWCEKWNHSVDYVGRRVRRFKVIVLPSTYEFSYAIANTVFFCRDQFESKQNMPDAVFCHDMAFYIGRQFLTSDKGEGKGYFFRGDSESAGQIIIPPENQDISLLGNHLASITPFFDAINRFAVIYTDRLHVAIAACLLEKEVHLYPGSYFKNRAVYESSMCGYFDGIYFHEHFDF